MKAVGREIRHKTESQLVVLNVPPSKVKKTYRLLLERAGAAASGVLVEEMVAGDREFLVGMRRDDAFGPVVAFGLGGVLTEALADGRRRPASRGVPLGPQEEPGSVGPSREADHGRCYYHRGDEADCGT